LRKTQIIYFSRVASAQIDFKLMAVWCLLVTSDYWSVACHVERKC